MFSIVFDFFKLSTVFFGRALFSSATIFKNQRENNQKYFKSANIDLRTVFMIADFEINIVILLPIAFLICPRTL